MKEHPLQQQIRIECSRGPVRLWLEQYSSERAPLDYLKRACGDITFPPEGTP